ncbi:hypothetical protein BS78_03G015600 [Paspalum vaginatum]|nr:hypothetical protein BS78_03G015600 [Paspalum vaginatum]
MAFLASSVLRATTGTGPCRFGTGRLPAAGHGIVVLPAVGRRAPSLLLLPSSSSSKGPVSKSAWVSAGTGSGGDSGEEDCELVAMFKAAVQMGDMFPLEPECMDLPGLHEKVVFQSLAEGSFDLWVNVANRLRASPNTEIYEGLHYCGNVFSIGKMRKKSISWKRASDLTDALDVLRRLVSSALQAPLPCGTWTLHDVPMEFNSERGVSLIAQRIYREVVDDIDFMFRAGGPN